MQLRSIRYGFALWFLVSVSAPVFAAQSPPSLHTLVPVTPAAQPADSETERNRIVMEQFADLLYRQKKVKQAFETFASPSYLQHSPMLADGVPAVVAALEPKFADPTAHFVVRKVIVDGDYAVIMIHFESPSHQGAVVDIYRLSEGKLVEHWDVGREFPDNPLSKHPLF